MAGTYLAATKRRSKLDQAIELSYSLFTLQQLIKKIVVGKKLEVVVLVKGKSTEGAAHIQ